MSRRSAPTNAHASIECLWNEVFTGIETPRLLLKGERAELPAAIAETLVKAGAARRV